MNTLLLALFLVAAGVMCLLGLVLFGAQLQGRGRIALWCAAAVLACAGGVLANLA